VDQKIMYFLD